MAGNKSRIIQIGSSLAVASLSMISPAHCVVKLAVDLLSGIGKKYFQDAIHPSINKLWASEKGLLSDPIRKEFKNAIKTTCDALLKKFVEQHPDMESWQRQGIKAFFADLATHAIASFEQHSHPALHPQQLTEYLLPDKTAEFYLGQLQISVSSEDWSNYYLPAHFEENLVKWFPEEFPLRFKEAIRNNDPAKKAVDLFFQTEIFQAIIVSKERTEELSTSLQEIKALVLPKMILYGELISGIDERLDRIERKLDTPRVIVKEFMDYKNYELVAREKEKEIVQLSDELSQLQLWLATEENEAKKSFLRKMTDSNSEHLRGKVAELEQVRASMAAFEQEVLELADRFSRVSIDTDRLQQAYGAFLSGDIRKASAILDEKDLRVDQQNLLAAVAQKEKDLKELTAQLGNNAEEYRIKAKLTELDYTQSDHVERAKSFYQAALKALRTSGNLLSYASFLFKQEFFDEAISTYRIIIDDFEMSSTHSEEEKYNYYVALSITGTHLKNQGLYQEAILCFENALPIIRSVADKDPQPFNSSVVDALVNLGNVYTDMAEHEKAHACFEDSFLFLQGISDDTSYLLEAKLIRTVASNGELFLKAGRLADADYFFKAAASRLMILPPAYFPEIGGIGTSVLCQLAEFHLEKKETDLGKQFYRQALDYSQSLLHSDYEFFLKDHIELLFDIFHFFWNLEPPEDGLPFLFMAIEALEKIDAGTTVRFRNLLIRAFEFAYRYYSSVSETGLAKEYLLKISGVTRPLANDAVSFYQAGHARVLTALSALSDTQGLFRESLEFRLEEYRLWTELAGVTPGVYTSDLTLINYNLGVTYLNLHEHENAIGPLRRAILLIEETEDKNQSPYWGSQGRCYSLLAMSYHDLRRYEEVISTCNDSLRLFHQAGSPKDDNSRILLCRIFAMKGVAFLHFDELQQEGRSLMELSLSIANLYPENPDCIGMRKFLELYFQRLSKVEDNSPG